MPANNLRIIYDNAGDAATLTASSQVGTLPVTNLQKDQKGLVWRSTGTTATITATWTTTQILSGVVFPFCNLTSLATIRVKLYAETNSVTPLLDTGAVSAAAYTPLGLWDWGAEAIGVNAYSYGGGTYGRAWFTHTGCKKAEITIADTSNIAGYIEASRLVIGGHWSPKYNTSFGLNVGYVDLSEQQRTQSGTLLTSIGTTHKKINFDLTWLPPDDRTKLLSILRGNGVRKGLFVSLFPEDTDTSKEQTYQIYGKLSTLSQITHPMYTVYASSIDIEEI